MRDLLSEMKKKIHLLLVIATSFLVASCSVADTWPDYMDPDRMNSADGYAAMRFPAEVTGLVTVKRATDGTVYLQYGQYKLLPGDIQFNGQQRAMASLTIFADRYGDYYRCTADWIEPLDMGAFSFDAPYATSAEDGIDLIMDSGYTCVEDGYLSVHYYTWWGQQPKHHDFTLFAADPANPFILEIRQNSHGDAHDEYSDGLVCFDINGLPDTAGETITIQLNWTKPDGTKGTAYFGFKTRE